MGPINTFDNSRPVSTSAAFSANLVAVQKDSAAIQSDTQQLQKISDKYQSGGQITAADYTNLRLAVNDLTNSANQFATDSATLEKQAKTDNNANELKQANDLVASTNTNLYSADNQLRALQTHNGLDQLDGGAGGELSQAVATAAEKLTEDANTAAVNGAFTVNGQTFATNNLVDAWNPQPIHSNVPSTSST